MEGGAASFIEVAKVKLIGEDLAIVANPSLGLDVHVALPKGVCTSFYILAGHYLKVGVGLTNCFAYLRTHTIWMREDFCPKPNFRSHLPPTQQICT